MQKEFKAVPQEYYQPAQNQGTMQRLFYTSNTYDEAEMEKHTAYFVFGQNFSEGNVIYCVAAGGTHSYEYCYQYIYKVLPHFFAG